MREKEIDRLDRERKKIMVEKEEVEEKSRAAEKALQSEQGKSEAEKVQERGRINEVIRQFDSDKQRIVEQYER